MVRAILISVAVHALVLGITAWPRWALAPRVPVEISLARGEPARHRAVVSPHVSMPVVHAVTAVAGEVDVEAVPGAPGVASDEPSGSSMDLEDILKWGNRRPEYPAVALSRGQEGRLRLRLFLKVDGRVERAEVAETAEVEAFNQSALTAALGWQVPESVARANPVLVVAVQFRLTE